MLGNELYTQYSIIIGVVISIVITASPLFLYLRRIQKTSEVTNSKSDAESLLYEHLKDQLELQKIELERYRDENNRLWEMIRGLEQRLLRVENLELDLTAVREKLREKELHINNQNVIIIELQNTIYEKDMIIESLEISLRH
jgi:cell shape-determining protein MreC